MKSQERQRIVLFLGGCGLILLGTAVMIFFGDTRLASSIGGMLTGMGWIFNLLQLFFKLPLEFSQPKNELFLPFSSLRRQKPQHGELILPASYYHALSKQQKARRDHIFNIAFGSMSIILFLLPFVGIGYLIAKFPDTTATSCTIVTKQIQQDQQLGKYGFNFTVRVKELDSSLETAIYPRGYDTLQAAQKELSRFLIGRTYACHVVPAQGYAGVTTSNFFTLDSDVPK